MYADSKHHIHVISSIVNFAYSSNGFTRVSLPEAIERIAAHGYSGVELLADRPHWHPGLGASDRAAILRALQATGLTVSNINANTAMALWPEWMPETVFEPALSNHDAAVRARRIDYTRAALDFAVEVGARCVSVTSGRCEADIEPGEGKRYFAEGLARICEDAAERGLKIGVEYEPGLLVETAAEVKAMIDAVGHPALGANLDIGHAICVGEDPADAIATLAGRIWNVHLEDIRGTKHFHLVPGEGDIDFAAVFAALEAHGYDNFITVELYTCSARADAAAAAAIEHLRRCAAPEPVAL
ncbi:MAG: protein FrlC [Bradymonadia bacterium]